MEGTIMRRRELLAGAAATVAATACRAAERVSLLDFLPPEQQRRIVAGRSDLDCAPIISRALGEAIVAHVPLWLPRGTYMLQPAHSLVHADQHFECLAAIRMVSGMNLVGEAGAILRIVPSFSTDLRPRGMAMFGTDEAIADVAIANLTLDMNGRANPISPDRAARRFSRLPQAQIFVSSPDGHPAARVDRARIVNTVFRDANGVSCIVMAQTSDPKAMLGRDWSLERCTFTENGYDTDDHSSVFAYAEDVTVDRCRFGNTRPYDGTGVNTAYEVHGARQRITGCTFGNMLRGIWVANNYSAETRDTLIAGNQFSTQFYGVDFFYDRPTACGVVNTRIEGNSFAFDDRGVVAIPRLDMKVAVQIASEFGQQSIRITGNHVTKTGERITGAFLVVTGGASGAQRHDRIVATNNSGAGLTFGSFIRTAAQAGLGTLTITDNRWHNLTPSATMGIAAGDAVERTGTAQPIRALALGGGSVSDNRVPRRTTYGIFLNTRIDRLNLRPLEAGDVAGARLALNDAGHIGVTTGSLDPALPSRRH